MKKILFGILLFLIIGMIASYNCIVNAADVNWHVGNNYSYNGVQVPLKSLNLTFKKKFNFASDGGLQGVCLAGNDVIGAFKRSETNTDVEILDKTSYELRKTLSGLNLGHANDCAYNFNTGDIIFAATGNTIKKLKYDSSYNLTKEEVVTVSSTSGVSAIAYDGDRDQYIVYRNKVMYITDLDFNIKKQFSVANNLVSQGVSYWKDHIYYVCDEFGEYSSEYQPNDHNSAEKNTSLVLIYNMDGTLVKALYIPKSDIMPNNTSDIDFPELESVSFYDDGTMLLGFGIYYNYGLGYSNGYNKDRAYYTTDSVKNDPDLTPVPKTISSISVSTLPTKTTYIQNYENLNLAGGKLTITYSDNSSEIKNLTDNDVTVTGFSNSTTGTKTLTVSYGGKQTTFNVTVVAKAVSSIQMKTNPTKTSYIQNYEDLDLTGGIIKITYNDTTTDEMSLTNENIQVTGFSNRTLGTKTLTVSYGGKTCTFSVNIVKKQISRIEMKTPPTKNKYTLNYEDLDLTGGSIKLTYNDTSTDEMSLTNENIQVTGFSNRTLGTKTLTVTYSGKTCTFTVEVVSKQVSEIEILEEPLKTYYLKNSEDLDLTGGVIKVTYNDESVDEISLTNEEITISGFSNKELGKKTVVVTYKGKQASFEVEIIEIKLNNNAKMVNVPNTLSFSSFVTFGMIFVTIGIGILIHIKNRMKNYNV